MLHLNDDTFLAIKSYVNVANQAAGKRGKAIDSLWHQGITSAMLIAPKKGEDASFYSELKSAVVAGFYVIDQNLLDKDIKTLSDQSKAKRKYLQQQIGSKIKDLKNALIKRETPALTKAQTDKAEADKAAKAAVESGKSTHQKLLEGLTNAKKLIGDDEHPTYDVTAAQKAIDKAIVIISG
tara:strand:+ start:2720 stop:3262 length:543 start_codon:yes stop_codon:yes gene_type:complete